MKKNYYFFLKIVTLEFNSPLKAEMYLLLTRILTLHACFFVGDNSCNTGQNSSKQMPTKMHVHNVYDEHIISQCYKMQIHCCTLCTQRYNLSLRITAPNRPICEIISKVSSNHILKQFALFMI